MKKKVIVIIIVSVVLLAATLTAIAASGADILGLLRGNTTENGEPAVEGELMKSILGTDAYKTNFDDLTPYSYDDFLVRIVRRPAAGRDIISTASFYLADIFAFNDAYLIEKLIPVNDNCIAAEYKLEKNGEYLDTFVVFDKQVITDGDKKYENWRYSGELYFANRELTFSDFEKYKGETVRTDKIPFVVDFRSVGFVSDTSDSADVYSEENYLLKDGFVIVRYSVNSYEEKEITVKDVIFIPYGEQDDRFQSDSLIKYLFRL
ncbi:MAG: hypothetical protein IJU75_03445 [Clostridia bacterium]|nr:hypothetical protein [Clostridia bacterium]